MAKVYPVGYSTYQSEEYIKVLMNNPNMRLIDIRYNPHSWRIQWQADNLRAKYRERYRLAGQYLGNVNYHYKNGWPIKIADMGTGIAGLVQYLNEGHDLILLCQCADYQACHRKVIVEQLKEAKPEVEIVQPGQRSQARLANTLKCLSIQQPWAHLIISGAKDVENREWRTAYRGPVLIHTGAKVDQDWFTSRGELDDHPMLNLASVTMPDRQSLYPTRSIVGMATLVDVVTKSSSPWFCGTYGFVFTDAKAFQEPIRYPGSLKLFEVEREVIARVKVKP